MITFAIVSFFFFTNYTRLSFANTLYFFFWQSYSCFLVLTFTLLATLEHLYTCNYIVTNLYLYTWIINLRQKKILITDEVSCKIKTEEKKSAFFNFSKLLLEVIHRQVYLVLGESIIHMEHTGLLCTCIIRLGIGFIKMVTCFV